MNEAELNALRQPLSNAARVLYSIMLRPSANQVTGSTEALGYKKIMPLLNDAHHQFTLGRQINSLLKELIDVGLVALPNTASIDKSLNGKAVILPLVVIEESQFHTLHKHKMAMHMAWKPDSDLAAQLVKLVGLIESDFSDDDIGDFVAYWMGRPEALLTEFQWTQKFISFIKQKRIARSLSTQKKVGSQLTSPKSGIEADENARKLVEKYSSKQ